MAGSNLKTTEIGVKMDPRLMAEVDLWPRIYGIPTNNLGTHILKRTIERTVHRLTPHTFFEDYAYLLTLSLI